ncbi:GntR family transcriptional regulator [Ramlibacter sp.]|uniref:GntR family transcriptional regulator n=1 Tax=Ramlibacter sp. TaxID=1917967 RepID=UPI0026122873|nr:GntR family transcriptional regulator [Ramlibacter sp.]MDB5956084.1 Transcriptional regulator, GntR family protein [Ramlibacter sp.]
MSQTGAQAASRASQSVQDIAPVEASAGKRTLAQLTYARIKDNIFEFRMAPGQRYAEQELATRLGVSRTPLRFALHVLAREGYLVRLEGHACWQVKPFELAYYEDLYDFRTQMELIAVRRLCALAPAPDLSALCDFWLTPPASRTREGGAVARADENFHSALVALAGNAEMARTHASLTERIRIIRSLDFISEERIDAAFDEHAQILHALLARNAAEAETLVQRHIDGSRAEISRITLQRLALAAAHGGAGRSL